MPRHTETVEERGKIPSFTAESMPKQSRRTTCVARGKREAEQREMEENLLDSAAESGKRREAVSLKLPLRKGQIDRNAKVNNSLKIQGGE